MSIYDKFSNKVSQMNEEYEQTTKELRDDDFDIRKIRKQDLKRMPKTGYILLGVMVTASLVMIILGFVLGI